MSARKKIRRDTLTKILVQSKRRCCLCVFLDNHTGRRKGQIAHLDRNPTNSAPDNLVFLCFEHHDEFDSQTSQGKNLTVGEIKEYRRRLSQIVAKQDVAIAFPRVTSEGESAKPSISSGRLLGSIFDAFDRDLKGLEKGAALNGIALSHLAKKAATEQGDFRAAKEAFLSLIRLAGRRGDRSSLRHPVTTADLVSSADQALRTFAKVDFSLTFGALHALEELALLGDVKMQELEALDHSIPQTFYPSIQLLCRVGRTVFEPDQKWIYGLVSSGMARLLFSAGMLAVLQGVVLPPAPKILSFTAAGVRTIPEGADPRSEPFVWAASRVAMLASPAFDYAMEKLKFEKSEGEIGIDPTWAAKYGDAKKILRRFGAILGFLPRYSAVSAQEDVEPCVSFRQEIELTGERVALAAKEFVAAERELALKRKC